MELELETIVLILHILGAGLLFAVVLFSVFLTVNPDWSESKLNTLRYVSQFGKWGSAWQFFTGLYLAWDHFDYLKGNKVFWAKMVLYVVEGTLAALLIEKKIKSAQGPAKDQVMSVAILTHAILIVLIISLGVLLSKH